MTFRVAGRHDSLLVAGFAFALLVIFQRSLQYLFEIARSIELSYGVALVPALLILTVMFVFHLHANRREARAEAAAAAERAEMAMKRARELEQLMAFGQSLSRALNADALHETIWRHMPILSGGAEVWVVIRRGNDWERATDRGCTRWPDGHIEAVADAVIAESPATFERPEGVECRGFYCYAVTAAGRITAVVGMPASQQSADDRRTVGTAAALLGIAVRNLELFTEVRENGLKDALTGCFNHAHGLETLEAELCRARRSGTGLSILLFDVDHFKRINDEHGHPCGDQVLAAVGQRLRDVLRRSDVRCRYGGDEFLVVLPETAAAGAARVAEWLRGEIEQISVIAAGSRVTITASIGAATAHLSDTAEALIDRADRALYAAKAAGRNCVRHGATGPRPITTLTVAAANA